MKWNFIDNTYFKYFILAVFIFIIMNLAVNRNLAESVIITLLIIVSLIIIENVISLTKESKEELDCNKCKIYNTEGFNTESENKQIISNEMVEQVNTVVNEIATTLSTSVKTVIDSVLPKKGVAEGFQSLNKNSSAFSTVDYTNDFVLDADKPIQSINSPESENSIPVNSEIPTNSIAQDDANIFTDNKGTNAQDVSNYINDETRNAIRKEIEDEIRNEILTDTHKKNTNIVKDITKAFTDGLPSAETIFGTNQQTYDADYTEYQQNGDQAKDSKLSYDANVFRMDIGDPRLVQPYMKDGKTYYTKIFKESSQAPKTYEALNSELKYGDFNYIGPLNKGMTNKEYTFIAPDNWFPVSPFPPVCVTNKQCTTCPIQINNGNDYMSFASLEEFDQARRFSGNMGINIDYIKNVLNNDNGF